MSMFRAAIDMLPGVHDSAGRLLTQHYLGICRLTLPVIDQFGAAFGLVKGDISGNIERLEARYSTDPPRFEHLFSIVEDEVARNDHNHGKSCTKGVLWLNRAMLFMNAILRRVRDDQGATLSTIVSDTYTATLAQYHGFLAYGAFTVAFKFVPTKEVFLQHVAGTTEATDDMAAFIDAFAPVLEEVLKWLDDKGLNDPTRV